MLLVSFKMSLIILPIFSYGIEKFGAFDWNILALSYENRRRIDVLSVFDNDVQDGAVYMMAIIADLRRCWWRRRFTAGTVQKRFGTALSVPIVWAILPRQVFAERVVQIE